MPEQNYTNHTRFDPPLHFVIMPLLLLNLGLAVYTTVHAWPLDRGLDHLLHLAWIVLSIALLLMPPVLRAETLTVQNRVIRLEERLRLAALLPAADLARVDTLTPRQLVALRFASDAELPALALRAAQDNLAPKAIKQAIQHWRPDHLRA